MNNKLFSAKCLLGSIVGGILLIIIASAFPSCAHAQEPFDFIPDTHIKVERLATAIFWAEGGHKTNFPFGIKSIPCTGNYQCRKYCKNTIRNNIKRWVDSGTKEEYLLFLARRYAPIGASNDPNNLNTFWIKNVKYFLKENKDVEKRL